MKAFRLLVIGLLVLTMSVTYCSASYYSKGVYLFGDADGDNELTILDSTGIQRHIAELSIIDDEHLLYSADIDRDNEVTVMDATKVQRVLCELDVLEEREKYYADDIFLQCLYADHDSGRAYTGDTVRFCVDAEAFNTAPIRYEFRVDNVLVQVGENVNELEYTFTEANNHNIEVAVYNRFGRMSSASGKFRVYDANLKPDTLYMTGVHFNTAADDPFSENTRVVYENRDGVSTITVNCAGGAAPYQYRFDFDNGAIVSDFSDSNSFNIHNLTLKETELNNGFTDYPLTICIRDAAGQEIQETITVRVVMCPVG